MLSLYYRQSGAFHHVAFVLLPLMHLSFLAALLPASSTLDRPSFSHPLVYYILLLKILQFLVVSPISNYTHELP